MITLYFLKIIVCIFSLCRRKAHIIQRLNVQEIYIIQHIYIAQSVSKCVFLLFQASYLVGVSDPNSHSGHEGLVDPIQFAKAHQAIQMACQNLVDPASSPSQVRMVQTGK